MRPSSGGPVGGGEPGPARVTAVPPDEPMDQRSLRYLFRVYGGFRGGALRLLGTSFLNAIGGGMAWFVLILYIYELFPQLGNVGVIFSLASWTSVFVFFPGGVLVDRYDHRHTLAFSFMLAVLSMVMFSIAQSLAMVVFGQVLNGVSNAIMRPALQALMTEKTTDVRRKYLFSMQSFIAMLGIALASVLAGSWTLAARAWFGMDLEGAYRVLFMVASLANLVAIVVALSIRPGEEGREDRREILPSLVDEGEDEVEARRRAMAFIIKFSTPMGLIGFGAGVVVPFFQLYYNLKFDVDVANIAWLFALTQVSMGLSFFLIPNLAERRGTIRAVVATQGVAILNLAAIPFAPTFLVAAPFHLVRMALMNASTPIQNSLMMGAVRPADRGKATAIAQIIWTTTNSTGMMLSGFVMERFGLDFPFVIAVSFYTLALGLFWFWFRRVGEM